MGLDSLLIFCFFLVKLLKLLRPLGPGCRSCAWRLKGTVVTPEDKLSVQSLVAG